MRQRPPVVDERAVAGEQDLEARLHLLLDRRTKLQGVASDPLMFIHHGEWMLSLKNVLAAYALDGNPLSVAEAEEFLRLYDWMLDEDDQEYDEEDGMPWSDLVVLDAEGRRAEWPPLLPDQTQPPKRGGGHKAGSRLRGRVEFPWQWTNSQILDRLVDIARNPRDGHVVPLPGGLFRVWDLRHGVLCEVLVERGGGITTGYPISGPGVHHNAGRDAEPVTDLRLDRTEQHLVNELGAVLDILTLALPRGTADSLYSLYRAGEWQVCVRVLRAALREHRISLDLQQHEQLQRLAIETEADQALP